MSSCLRPVNNIQCLSCSVPLSSICQPASSLEHSFVIIGGITNFRRQWFEANIVTKDSSEHPSRLNDSPIGISAASSSPAAPLTLRSLDDTDFHSSGSDGGGEPTVTCRAHHLVLSTAVVVVRNSKTHPSTHAHLHTPTQECTQTYTYLHTDLYTNLHTPTHSYTHLRTPTHAR